MDTNTDTSDTADAAVDNELALLTERVENPKRLLQAARGLTVLESDLRSLMQHDKVTDGAAAYAAETYTALRTEVIDLLDDDGAAAAADPVLGMPAAPDPAAFSTTLLVVSQATRFLGIEEGWPGMLLASRAQRQQIDEHVSKNGSGAPDVPTGLVPGQVGPGYI